MVIDIWLGIGEFLSPWPSRFSLFLCLIKFAFVWLKQASVNYKVGNASKNGSSAALTITGIL